MIEQKLQCAANTMPEPKCDFPAIEKVYQRQSSAKPRIKRRLVAIVCLSLFLVGCVAGPTVPEYHLYNGSMSLLFPGIGFDVLIEELGWDPELNSAKKVAEELGWSIPDTLGGSPCYGADKFNLTTQASHWFTAMLLHHYTYHSVLYGYEMVTELTREDGTLADAHWTDADIDLMFGSTENPIWRRQFGFDENDAYIGYPSSKEAENAYDLEYEGITLYIRTYRYDNNFYDLLSYYGQYVCWVDYDHNTVFSLYSRDDTPDFAIECAKELIDQMH